MENRPDNGKSSFPRALLTRKPFMGEGMRPTLVHRSEPDNPHERMAPDES